MSEEADSEESPAPEEDAEEKGGLEKAVEGRESSESQPEETKDAYSSSESKYASSKEGADAEESSEADTSEKNTAKDVSSAKANLETRLGQAEKEMEALVQKIVKETGMKEDEARALVSSMKSAYDRKEAEHDWADEDKYWDRVKKYVKINNLKDLLSTIKEAIKGTWYLFFSLTSISPDGDPKKDIDDGAWTLYFPGWMKIPDRDRVDEFAKVLGRKVAYVSTTNMEEIRKIIDYAASKHGRVQLLGFSDGEKIVNAYLNENGDSKIDMAFTFAGNPPDRNYSRLVSIIGDRDRCATLENPYTWRDEGYKGVKPKTVYGGHTYFLWDKETMKQTAAIINSYTPTRAYYLTRPADDSGVVLRKAA